CSGDCKAPTNGCKNDSRRGSTPWSKLRRTSASFSSSSSRIRKRRSIDPSPFSGFLPLKKLIQQILTAAQVRDTVELPRSASAQGGWSQDVLHALDFRDRRQ